MFPDQPARPSARRRHRTAALALAGLALVAAPACAGSDADGASQLPSLASDSADDGADADADDEAGPDPDVAAESDVDDDAARGDDDSDAEVDPELAMAEFEQCMKEQGIDIASAGDGGFTQEIELSENELDAELSSGIDGQDAVIARLEAASAACDPILEDAFGSFEMTPEQEAEAADQMAEMRRCLADEGIESDLGDGGAFVIEGDDTDAIDAAMQKCGGAVGTIDMGDS